jgi:hypothetical protein
VGVDVAMVGMVGVVGVVDVDIMVGVRIDSFGSDEIRE